MSRALRLYWIRLWPGWDVPLAPSLPDGKYSVDANRCVGACGLAPVMMVNDDVYGRMTPDQVDDVLAKYK